MQRKRKKLLIISDYFYPHWTGLSKSFYYLIEALDSTLDCTVLTVRFKPDLKKRRKIV